MDANSGDYDLFNESLSGKDLVTALMASSATPFYYPYIPIGNTIYFGGNLAKSLDLSNGIVKC